MRISVILFFGIFMQVSASGWAQKVNVRESKTTYKELFKEVERQTGLITILSNDEMDINSEVNVEEGSIELKELYEQILKDANMDFRLVDDYIVVKPAVKKPVKFADNIQEEKKIIIRGTVKDEQGEPLPFAAVCFKGTTTGCVSAVDGTYELEAPDEEGLVLEISSLGFVTQEIPVDGRTQINIVMVEDIQGLAEVVVTGYQTISKERATGSFQIVNADDLTNVASVDLTDRLQGVSPGVRVDGNTGEIIIRGQGTLDADKTPLIVVNGIPYLGQLSEINPDDVEQMTVLKDAASTSIYGVRGANGVIVITTKNSNTKGKLNVSYNNTFQFGEKARMADLNLLNAQQHGDAEWEIYDRVGLVSYPWYSFKSEVGEIYDRYQTGQISEDEAKIQMGTLTSRDNWDQIEKYFMQSQFVQKHTLSFNYGNDKNQFYASVSYDEDKSMWAGNNGDNISFNLNDVFSYNEYLALSVSAFGNFRKRSINGNPAYGPNDMTKVKPYNRFKDENWEYINEAVGSYDAAQRESFENMGLLPFFYNRLQEMDLSDKESKTSNLATNAKIDVTPTDWLKLSASIGYNIINGRAENLQDKNSFVVRSYVNKFTAFDDNGNLEQHVPYGHIMRSDDYYSENITSRLQLSLKKQFNELYVGFNAGLEQNNFKTQNNLSNRRYNYHSQRLTENYVNLANMESGIFNAMGYNGTERNLPYRTQTEYRYQSMFFIGNATYKGKYDISGSWRLDKTNLFGQSPDYRDQPSWSVGAKWIMSEEDFFEADWVNSLGLKVSYGLAGNVDRSTSPYLIGQSYNDYWTQEPAIRVLNPENPLLGWEKTYTTNIGIDYALFNNCISGSVEYYNKHSKDVLALVSLDPTNGFANAKINNGQILNRGIDFAINANIVRRADFAYNVGLNFSYNYNEITEISVNSATRSQLERGSPYKGQAVDYIYGYKNAGVDNTGEPLVHGPNGVISWQEMASFELTDGTFFGRRTPPVFGSFIQNLTYKNLSADIFILYDFGHFAKMYNNPYLNSRVQEYAMPDIIDTRWRSEGDENSTDFPKIDNGSYSAQDRDAAVWNSDLSITNADVIQLKSINLTYDFTSLLNVKAIKGLRLKVGIENLWHWTAAENDKIYDRMYTFPRYKNYTMGLSMQF